jgi:hypothetical protein
MLRGVSLFADARIGTLKGCKARAVSGPGMSEYREELIDFGKYQGCCRKPSENT